MKRLALLLAAVLLTGCAAPASVPASSNIPEQTAETSSLLYWTPYTSIPNESGYFSFFHSDSKYKFSYPAYLQYTLVFFPAISEHCVLSALPRS